MDERPVVQYTYCTSPLGSFEILYLIMIDIVSFESNRFGLKPTTYRFPLNRVLHQLRIIQNIYLPLSIQFFEQDYGEYCTRINASSVRGRTKETAIDKSPRTLLKTIERFDNLHVIGHNITIGSFGRYFLRDVIGLAFVIRHNITIGSFGGCFLWDVIVLALVVGHNITIGSFGRVFLRNVVGLALDKSTVNLREMVSDS